jgi:hypothetical protein
MDALLMVAAICMAIYCLTAMTLGWPLSAGIIWFAASNAFWAMGDMAAKHFDRKSEDGR